VDDFDFQMDKDQQWRMENKSTGETVSGYLNP
jgi:hypothetical protein